MRVVQHRFRAFHQAFGRDPSSREPLFFVQSGCAALPANTEQAIAQLLEAAQATGTSAATVLSFLGLRGAERIAEIHRRFPDRRAHPR